MVMDIGRRQFISVLGGAAVAYPLTARAQQPVPVVGFLNSRSAKDSASADFVAAFRQGLGDVGFVEPHNVAIQYQWADGEYERLPAMATDLISRQVAVIAAAFLPAVQAVRAATTTIPIVFNVGGDPVALGLVTALNRPGGNLTGVSQFASLLETKRLELLHEAVPQATTIVFLVNPTNPNAEVNTGDMQTAARTLGLELRVISASTESEIDAAFAALVQRTGGLVVQSDSFFNSRREQIVALAMRNKVPAIYDERGYTVAGGLMNYTGSQRDAFRQVGVYTGRILKGEKPADLPVQQSTKVEFIINLKIAKALGLTVPLSLLGRADEVIE
jgi:putative tryptophan/tyrosine transport system substrate-binding protein